MTEDELYSQIGKNIRSLRQVVGITQKELAEAVGRSRVTITNIERGIQKPPLWTYYQICEALRAKAKGPVPAGMILCTDMMDKGNKKGNHGKR